MRHENYIDHYDRISVLLPLRQKEFLLNYKASSGRDITFVIKQLVGRLMTGDIELIDQGPRPRKISGYQRGK